MRVWENSHGLRHAIAAGHYVLGRKGEEALTRGCVLEDGEDDVKRDVYVVLAFIVLGTNEITIGYKALLRMYATSRLKVSVGSIVEMTIKKERVLNSCEGNWDTSKTVKEDLKFLGFVLLSYVKDETVYEQDKVEVYITSVTKVVWESFMAI